MTLGHTRHTRAIVTHLVNVVDVRLQLLAWSVVHNSSRAAVHLSEALDEAVLHPRKLLATGLLVAVNLQSA